MTHTANLGLSVTLPDPPSPFDRLSLEEQLQIDAQCDVWESSLSGTTIPSIDDLLREMRNPDARHALRLELLLTQIDYLADRQPEGNASCLLTFLEETYHRWPDFAVRAEEFGILVARAFHWSQHHEPRPDVYDYVSRFTHVPGVERRVRQCLARDWPILLRLELPTRAFEVLMTSPLTIGRQRKDDPDPPSVVSSDCEDARLVVAPREELRVSRSHARLELVSQYRIQVVNTSQSSELLIDGEIKLLPGEIVRRKCPLRIQLFGCVIHLTRI